MDHLDERMGDAFIRASIEGEGNQAAQMTLSHDRGNVSNGGQYGR